LEYDPPGLLVTTSRLMPMAVGMSSDLTTQNPKNGNTKNWRNNPAMSASRFDNAAIKFLKSTVADIQNTSAKSRPLLRKAVPKPISSCAIYEPQGRVTIPLLKTGIDLLAILVN